MPQLAGATGKEMLTDALRIIRTSGGSAAEKADLFEKLAAQITQRTGGSWRTTRSAGMDGSVIFVGEQIGRVLVVSPRGELFLGNVTKDVGSFIYHRGGAVTPVYERLKKVE